MDDLWLATSWRNSSNPLIARRERVCVGVGGCCSSFEERLNPNTILKSMLRSWLSFDFDDNIHKIERKTPAFYVKDLYLSTKLLNFQSQLIFFLLLLLFPESSVGSRLPSWMHSYVRSQAMPIGEVDGLASFHVPSLFKCLCMEKPVTRINKNLISQSQNLSGKKK